MNYYKEQKFNFALSKFSIKAKKEKKHQYKL